MIFQKYAAIDKPAGDSALYDFIPTQSTPISSIRFLLSLVPKLRTCERGYFLLCAKDAMSGFVWKRVKVLKRTAADVFCKHEEEDDEEDGEVRTIVL